MNAAALRATILAAGLSSRMRELKPLLPRDAVPAVLRVADAYRDVGLEAVVVLGFGVERVAPLLNARGALLGQRGFRGPFTLPRSATCAITGPWSWTRPRASGSDT